MPRQYTTRRERKRLWCAFFLLLALAGEGFVMAYRQADAAQLVRENGRVGFRAVELFERFVVDRVSQAVFRMFLRLFFLAMLSAETSCVLDSLRYSMEIRCNFSYSFFAACLYRSASLCSGIRLFTLHVRLQLLSLVMTAFSPGPTTGAGTCPTHRRKR